MRNEIQGFEGMILARMNTARAEPPNQITEFKSKITSMMIVVLMIDKRWRALGDTCFIL
jgi:hypothetical protein